MSVAFTIGFTYPDSDNVNRGEETYVENRSRTFAKTSEYTSGIDGGALEQKHNNIMPF
jgi:hypothetical protein